MKKEDVLKNSLKRLLNTHQLYRQCLKDIQASETVAELAKKAKENKVKNWIDLRVVAAEAIRSQDAMMTKIRATMQPETIREIYKHFSSEQLLDLSLVMDVAFNIKNLDKLVNVLETCVIPEEEYNKQQEQKHSI